MVPGTRAPPRPAADDAATGLRGRAVPRLRRQGARALYPNPDPKLSPNPNPNSDPNSSSDPSPSPNPDPSPNPNPDPSPNPNPNPPLPRCAPGRLRCGRGYSQRCSPTGTCSHAVLPCRAPMPRSHAALPCRAPMPCSRAVLPWLQAPRPSGCSPAPQWLQPRAPVVAGLAARGTCSAACCRCCGVCCLVSRLAVASLATRLAAGDRFAHAPNDITRMPAPCQHMHMHMTT